MVGSWCGSFVLNCGVVALSLVYLILFYSNETQHPHGKLYALLFVPIAVPFVGCSMICAAVSWPNSWPYCYGVLSPYRWVTQNIMISSLNAGAWRSLVCGSIHCHFWRLGDRDDRHVWAGNGQVQQHNVDTRGFLARPSNDSHSHRGTHCCPSGLIACLLLLLLSGKL